MLFAACDVAVDYTPNAILVNKKRIRSHNYLFFIFSSLCL